MSLNDFFVLCSHLVIIDQESPMSSLFFMVLRCRLSYFRLGFLGTYRDKIISTNEYDFVVPGSYLIIVGRNVARMWSSSVASFSVRLFGFL